MAEYPVLAEEAMKKLIAEYDFQTVLDVGCGHCGHLAEFRSRGKTVTGIDRYPRGGEVLGGDYLQHTFARPFDCIWASHVLEHQVNVQQFLHKVFRDLRDGGILAITVPPLKHELVGGHVTLWNAGLLIYNLIVAGFDCREARVKRYGYNISLITPKIPAQLPSDQLRFANGDLELLASFFPAADQIAWRQSIHGDFADINWSGRGVQMVARRRRWWPSRRAA